MWNWLWTKKQLDIQKTYLRIEFLTAKEKADKIQCIKALQQKYQNDQESIVPYEGSFSTSFKFTLNTTEISGVGQPIKNKMILKELMCHLQVTKNQQLQQFLHTYVKEIQIFIHNQKMVDKNEILPLYSEIQTSMYNPQQILEIIYEPFSVWQRLKNRGKKMLSNLPRLMFSLAKRVICLILGVLGFETSATGFIFKLLPAKSMLQWLISFIGMFFPMFSPFINMGSKYLLS